METLAIVIPAFNEEDRIGPTLDAYRGFFRQRSDVRAHIIVVLNGCVDATRAIVARRAGGDMTVLEFARAGKGFAVIEGFKRAIERGDDVIGFVDADMATTPVEFHRLYERLGDADAVIADRYIEGSVIDPRPSFKRWIASRVLNVFIRVFFLFPYRDTQCGAKVVRRQALERVISNIQTTEWAFDVELLYELRASNCVVRAVSTTWADREYSKVNFFRAGPFLVLGVARLRLLHSRLSFVVRAYDRALGLVPRIRRFLTGRSDFPPNLTTG